jgi:hypothetical protein
MEDKEENLSDNFISRWSKRKSRNNIKDNSEVKKDSLEQIKEKETSLVEEDEGEYEDLNDDELLEKFKLPNPEKIKKEKGLDVFFKKGVPDRLRQIALRRVWKLNPIIRFADAEINDYHEDFTDAATVVEGMQTAYQVGKGYLSEILESQDDEGEQDENVKEEIKKEKLAKTKVSKKINSKEKIKKDDKVDIVEQESVEVKNQVEGNQRNDLDIIAQKKEELLIDEDLKKPRPKMMTFTPKA